MARATQAAKQRRLLRKVPRPGEFSPLPLIGASNLAAAMARKPHVRLMFNEAVGKLLFDDGLCKWLRLRLEGNAVWLMGAGRELEGEIPIAARPRGGFEAQADGQTAEWVCRTLNRAGGPFFTFRRVLPTMHWYVAEASAVEPLKTEPAMRVW